MDVLFEDNFKRNLIVELKTGPIKDEHIGQILSYEGMLLSADDPTIRVMLIGIRVPPNIQRSLDHHGIAWRETNASSIILSDLCYNRKNKGIPFEKHLFEYQGHGAYLCLGENYLYTGFIYQRPQGQDKESIAGEWKEGVKILY